MGAFLQFRLISENPAYARAADNYLQREGLADEPELLIELERVYSEAIASKRARSEKSKSLKGRRG